MAVAVAVLIFLAGISCIALSNMKSQSSLAEKMAITPTEIGSSLVPCRTTNLELTLASFFDFERVENPHVVLK